ncbi:MAG: hypothetical protein NC817_00560, partial [Candidatus Omnitrophica bacterium]|nr:hypothetical protein [Candidatus Omnitrophota bacterium]
MNSFKSIKTQLIIFLIIFAIFIVVRDKDLIFLFNCFLSAVFALILEGAILYFKSKMFKLKESAIITGLIIGYVLSSDSGMERFLIANTLAIGSKYIIRFHKRHIFNPAGFGIFISTVFFNNFTHWKGTYIWYIIIPLGIYFTYRLRKIEIVFSYIILSFLLFGWQTLSQNRSLEDIWGYLSYFYIFIMVIEPKTSSIDMIGKYIFGIGLAIFIFVFTGLGA